MAYAKYYAGGWKDLPDQTTPIVAAALDTIDAGILTADTAAAAAVPKSVVTTAGDIVYATGNAALTRLALGAAGNVLKGGASAPSWGKVASADIDSAAAIKLSQLSAVLADAPPGTQLAYNEFTANVACTATSEATATQIVAASAVTFDAATAVWIEFYAANYDAGDAPAFSLYLYDGSSSIGILHQRAIAASTAMGFLHVARKLTPSNASHTYSVRGSVSSGGGVSVKAGAGGAGAVVPGFIRITKA